MGAPFLAWGPPSLRGDPPQPSRHTWRPFLPKSSVPATRSSGRRSGGWEARRKRAGRRAGSAERRCPALARLRRSAVGSFVEVAQSSSQHPWASVVPADAFLIDGASASAEDSRVSLDPPQPGDPVGVTHHPGRSPLHLLRVQGSPRGTCLSVLCILMCFSCCSLQKCSFVMRKQR